MGFLLKRYYLLACIATVFIVALNEVNRSYLNDTTPYRFGLIATADEASYLVPPVNWIEAGEWKDNSNGITAFFQRPPGYGLLYLPCLILGKYSLLGLKIIHIILFFLSIFLFRAVLEQWRIGTRGQWIGTFLFALLPAYSGFMYYTLTEAVMPFFVLWCALNWSKAFNGTYTPVALVTSSAMLLLIRPQLAFLLMAVLLALLIRRNYKALFWLSLSLLPIGGWYLRTGWISNEAPSLHPIYSETNNHLYRPSHAALTDLFRIWEWRSDIFHNQVGRIVRGDSMAIAQVVQELPVPYRSEVSPLLYRFNALNTYRETHFKNTAITSCFEGERSFEEDVYSTRTRLIAENGWEFYVKTPVRSAVEMLTLSHLNLFIFQGPWRGKWWMECMRVSSFAVITCSIALTALLLFLRRTSSLHYALILGMFAFLMYLFFVQRLNEDRYIYPLLPLFLAISVVTLHQINQRLKR